ncbi:MAG: hypothetical protein M3Q34_00800 [bacterium]|nr:hypothetical protein [bacterium]
MNKKILAIFILLIFTLLPYQSYAATEDTSNVGFIPANIWYSDTPDTEGEDVRIYTVVFNPYQKELSGTVSFYDNEVLLGKKDFAVPGVGIKDVYVEWTVTLGAHKIFAKINDTKYLVSKGVYEPVTLKENTSETSSYTVYKKILPKIEDIKQDVNKAVDDIRTPVNNFQQKILESTPDYVSKPIITSTNFLENWRGVQNDAVELRKTSIVAELEALKKESSKEEFLKEEGEVEEAEVVTETKGIGEKFKESSSQPFKYVELFFFTLISFIVGNKFVFYCVLIIIVATFIRLLWRMIFK